MLRASCANGVFNPTLNTCTCRYGWGGDACDVFELSACSRHDERRRRSPSRRGVSVPPARALVRVRSQQCVRHGAFVGHMRRECEKRVSQDEAFGWIASSPGWAPNRTVRLRPPSRASARLRPDETRWDALETCVASRPGRCCKHDNRCAQPPLFACFRARRGACVDGACACDAAVVRASAARTAPARRRRRRRAMGCGRAYDVPTIVLARRSYASDLDRQRLFSTLQARLCARTARRRRDAHRRPARRRPLRRAGGDDEFGRDAPSTSSTCARTCAARCPTTIDRRAPTTSGSARATTVATRSTARPASAPASPSRTTSRRGPAAARRATSRSRRFWRARPPPPARRTKATGRGGCARSDGARRLALLFFAGNLAIAAGYSEGVRQALYRHHANTSGFRIVGVRRRGGRSPLGACAAPLGEGGGSGSRGPLAPRHRRPLPGAEFTRRAPILRRRPRLRCVLDHGGARRHPEAARHARRRPRGAARRAARLGRWRRPPALLWERRPTAKRTM